MLDLLEILSTSMGVSKPAIRLVLSVLLGYPIALLYRHLNLGRTAKHYFLAFVGIAIVIFNYGYDLYHSALAVAVTYIFNKTLKETRYLVPASFTYHMGYLLIGYYYTTSESYDIKWTMPHCVLVLRLIGLAFDISDRYEKKVKNKLDDKCFDEVPSLIELMAFTYFPATVLVGPQFTFLRYERFTKGLYEEHTKRAPQYALQRFLLGCLYLAFNQYGATIVPDSYLMTEEFAAKSLIMKMLYVGLWGKVTLYKYISIWLLAEGGAVLFGITYIDAKPGDREYDSEELSGCTNIKVSVFENARKFLHFIEAFNVQTNKFVANNVYKRLKFLNNRHLSQLGALFFLAIWHGFHSGYYMTFFMEFLIVFFEKSIEPIFVRNENFMKFIEQPLMKPVVFIVIKFYTVVFSGWCLIPFVFLSFGKWWKIYSVINYFGFALFIPGCLFLKPILSVLLPPTVKKDKVVSAAAPTTATTTNVKTD